MIRARFLCLAVLFAGVACTATSTAPETAVRQEPGEAAVEQPASGSADAGSESAADESPVASKAEASSAVAMGAAGEAQDASMKGPLGQLRGRIDGFVPATLQTLDEVQASFDAARTHAQSVFTRLESLRVMLDEEGFTGAALDEQDRLEQEAAQLNETADALQDELNRQRDALQGLENRVSALEHEAGASGSEELSSADLSELETEAAALQESAAVDDLVRGSDRLVSRVAVLVSHVDRAERSVVGVEGEPLEGTGDASAAGSAPAAAVPVVAVDEEDDTVTPKGEIAEVITDKGTLLLQFFPDFAPAHVQNFKRLVRDGFYDGLTFHRVLPGYIIQGGCPTGDGFGGPGWQLDNEFNRRPHRRGTLSMARFAHPDSAGSQFFICLDDRPELDGKQTVFGRVISGEATLEAIERLGDPEASGMPTEPIIIQQVILRPWQEGDNEVSMIAGNPAR